MSIPIYTKLMARLNPQNDKIRPLTVDFLGGAVGHRFRQESRHGGGYNQPLPKAMGLKANIPLTIIDATAGLGRDAFLLASLGAKVTLIERSDHMHTLLADGMARAKKEGGEIAQTISRMTLLHGDAKDLLPSLASLKCQAILVDPMHPPRKKSALVKADMRQIRDIVGTDEDSIALMKIALATARKRVVLKWPARADPMPDIGPCTHQITGKSTRYDVFMLA